MHSNSGYSVQIYMRPHLTYFSN